MSPRQPGQVTLPGPLAHSHTPTAANDADGEDDGNYKIACG